MNSTSINDIMRLLDLFFDGATTIAQEKQLQQFFAQAGPLPEQLEQYRSMFAWYAAGMPEAGTEPARTEPTVLPAPRRFTRKAVAWWSSIAAAVVIAIALGWNHRSSLLNSDSDWAYADSYIIRNGCVIQGADEIIPDLEATRIEAINLEQEIDALMGLDNSAAVIMTSSPIATDTLPI